MNTCICQRSVQDGSSQECFTRVTEITESSISMKSCSQTGYWFVGGEDLTWALHVL